jgi:hypothetical protein
VCVCMCVCACVCVLAWSGHVSLLSEPLHKPSIFRRESGVDTAQRSLHKVFFFSSDVCGAFNTSTLPIRFNWFRL